MAGIEPHSGVGSEGRADPRLARLKRLRNALADEIIMSSDSGELMSPSSQAVMLARDALNHALAFAGDPEANQGEDGWKTVQEGYQRYIRGGRS